jgi:glutathione S-transferase
MRTDEMLKIWGRANSINVQKALWCCGELDLQYDRIHAGNKVRRYQNPRISGAEPDGLVPAFEDGDFQL